MKVRYRRLNLVWSSGSVDDVIVATTFIARLFGLRRKGVEALAIRASWVHTLGFRHPITVIETTMGGVVSSASRVVPNRVYRRRTGLLLVELVDGIDPPAVGEPIKVLACGVHGRHPHSLRDTHRKPRRRQYTPNRDP